AVKAVRSVADSYLPGGIVDVELRVQVDEAMAPNGAVIIEQLPSGWVLETSDTPPSSFSRQTGQARWLFVGGLLADTTIQYRARAALGASIPVHICGSALFNEATDAQCVATDCSGLVALPVHPADRDTNNRIEDAELLAWI